MPADAAVALARRAQFKERAAITALRRPQAEDWSPEDWQGYFGERAGIAEFDHGLPRPEAEAVAFKFCFSEWLRQHPVFSDAADGCPICGDTDRVNDPLLPIGIAGAGQTWLHIDCSVTWSTAMKAEAVAALASMGIMRQVVVRQGAGVGNRASDRMTQASTLLHKAGNATDGVAREGGRK